MVLSDFFLDLQFSKIYICRTHIYVYMEYKNILKKILNNRTHELTAEELNRVYNVGFVDNHFSLTRKGIDYLGLDFEEENK